MDYAHFDTSGGERQTPTAKFNRPHISKELQSLRESAFERSIPTADDETLNFIITQLRAVKPKNILELGTATGISAIAMLNTCPDAHLTTVEKNETFFEEAKRNFKCFDADMRVNAILGDAGEVIDMLKGTYDFIFMDCAKVQYIKYLPKLKKLLAHGGVLLADDILLFGWITGEAEIPPKRKMLAKHVEEYVHAVTNDSELSTTILNIGDGLALSVKL
ncbi:MAG: O-methyltransferase [Clostridia bacterium]|nr:O-methyltransferase [Clostridia bacterium]